MERTAVAAIRCSSYDPRALETALERQFQLLGGLNRFVKPGDRVLIKPNFIAPKPVSQPAQTHPQMILAVARLLTDLGARPFVGDSPAWGTVFSCAGALEGLTEGLAQLGIPLRALRHPRPCHVNAHTTVGISALALRQVLALLPEAGCVKMRSRGSSRPSRVSVEPSVLPSSTSTTSSSRCV